MEKELAAARRLALEAGAILVRHYITGPTVDWKAPGDPVTAADREANECIVRGLAREFPKDAILSEEQPDDLSRLEQSRVWMIDPMDGTREFIEHRGDFAVQIGLTIDAIPVLGVVFQPTTQKLYYAAQGRGAFVEVNGKTVQLKVSTEETAAQMTLAMSRSHHSPRIDAIRDKLRIPNVLRLGSVGLKVAALCEGRAQLYVHTGSRTHLWDTCGPEAILREAGGRMTDVFDQPLQYGGRELRNMNGLIASNSIVHERAVKAAQAVLAAFR